MKLATRLRGSSPGDPLLAPSTSDQFERCDQDGPASYEDEMRRLLLPVLMRLLDAEISPFCVGPQEHGFRLANGIGGVGIGIAASTDGPPIENAMYEKVSSGQ